MLPKNIIKSQQIRNPSLSKKAVQRIREIKEKTKGEDNLRKSLEERENAWNDYLKQLGEQRVRVLQMLKEGKNPEEISYFTEHLVQIQLDIILFGA